MKEIYNRNEVKLDFPDTYLEFINIKKFAKGMSHAIKDINFVADSKGKIEDLARGIVNLSNLIIQERADTVVLLDKSARPIAHFLLTLWRETYPEYHLPEIRFINIGRNEEDKDSKPKIIKQLIRAHDRSITGKRVIVADEIVSSGGSMRRAKHIIETIFPEAQRFVYAEVLDEQPIWYGISNVLGIYDVYNLINLGVSLEQTEKMKINDPDSFVSKSLGGVIRKHPQIKYLKEIRVEMQTKVNEFRGQISFFAKEIAKNCVHVPASNIKVSPMISERFNQEFNLPIER